MKLKYEGRDTSSSGGTVPSKLCFDEARLVADLRALMREYGLTRIEVEEANLEPRADRAEAEATAWKERAERAEVDIPSPTRRTETRLGRRRPVPRHGA